jgi:hypothetical protein
VGFSYTKNVVILIAGINKQESCRNSFKDYMILTLTLLFTGGSVFYKKVQRGVKIELSAP